MSGTQARGARAQRCRGECSWSTERFRSRVRGPSELYLQLSQQPQLKAAKRSPMNELGMLPRILVDQSFDCPEVRVASYDGVLGSVLEHNEVEQVVQSGAWKQA